MNITDAKIEHLPQIEKIEKSCFSLPWTTLQIEKQIISDSCIFLSALDSQGNVIGYVNLIFVVDEGYIGNLAVEETHRRQGVAEALLRELEQRCILQHLAFITLEVRQSNAAAIALYHKCGFSNAGVRKNYYVNPQEDAVLMTKFLPSTQP